MDGVGRGIDFFRDVGQDCPEREENVRRGVQPAFFAVFEKNGKSGEPRKDQIGGRIT